MSENRKKIDRLNEVIRKGTSVIEYCMAKNRVSTLSNDELKTLEKIINKTIELRFIRSVLINETLETYGILMV